MRPTMGLPMPHNNHTPLRMEMFAGETQTAVFCGCEHGTDCVRAVQFELTVGLCIFMIYIYIVYNYCQHTV